MDFKQIQELIKMINKSNIGEVSIEEKGFKLTIKQKEEPVQNVYAAPVQQPISMPQQAQPPRPLRCLPQFRSSSARQRSLRLTINTASRMM